MDTGALLIPLVVAWAHLQERNLGRKRCRKEGVGGLIRELERDIPVNGVGPQITARREAAGLLRMHCGVCGKCRESHE